MFTKGFRTVYRRDEHFDEHGSDFGAKDEADYEEKANTFLGGLKGESVLECTRPLDGAILRFDWRTQAYGVLSSDGYIQTYYIPDPA